MSFGSPNPGYGQPQDPNQPYGHPQQGQAGYGYPQAPGVPPQGGYGYPQQPAGYGYQPVQPSYANWGQRFAGTLVDGLVFAVPYILVLVGRNVPALIAIGGLAILGIAIWQLIMEGRTGQTVGKKVLGIRLVRESDGQPIGVGMAFVRRIAHFLDSLPCYLGWLWPAWDAKRQTFADKVCSTIVIRSN
ncbi:RDD family protein [Streptomyces sp. NPDC052109]|uniref:RDD family protein n=1 Tax=Streptomyces sp. NPDC052109 TaxID=3155527 RepID=UPI00342E48F7